ncbi:hypothetical protein LMG3441_00745 [Achromobacter kerstersii]|uniref:Uncharacterized protein n=1 Tax=Achromobacter kerstersii TaxID=1353890 RepID=A0A6S6Z830_9BURK|nr:hypothetical protein LMG3441_00745 [Achromobacter kerstersii]
MSELTERFRQRTHELLQNRYVVALDPLHMVYLK